MGSSSKGGGMVAGSPQSPYGGSIPNQALYDRQMADFNKAQADYKQKMTAWRAPTTQGRAAPAKPYDPSKPFTGTPGTGVDMGPKLPAMGVLPTAPVAPQMQYVQQQAPVRNYGILGNYMLGAIDSAQGRNNSPYARYAASGRYLNGPSYLNPRGSR